IDDFALGAAGVRVPYHLPTEFPFVGAALGDDVDHAAGGATELRAVATGDGLVLRDAAEGQRGGAQGGIRVGHRVSVDVIRVLRRGRATERGHVAETARPLVPRVAAHGAGRQQGEG